jgi:hypothetical protein
LPLQRRLLSLQNQLVRCQLGVNNHRGELQVAASGPVEGHKQPLPSFEPDTIHNLVQAIACGLVGMVEGSYRMEVRKGLVYPHQILLDNV